MSFAFWTPGIEDNAAERISPACSRSYAHAQSAQVDSVAGME